MELYERIMQIRKKHKLSQAEFGQSLNMSRANIANIEVGRVNITDRVIADICRQYGVDEHWLRTGEGEMYAQRSSDEKLADYIGTLLASDDESVRIQRAVISMLADLPPESWQLILNMAKLLQKNAGDLWDDGKTEKEDG